MNGFCQKRNIEKKNPPSNVKKKASVRIGFIALEMAQCLQVAVSSQTTKDKFDISSG